MLYTFDDEKDIKHRFEKLYQQEFKYLKMNARSFLHAIGQELTTDQIEETVQETFIFGWENRVELFEKLNPGGWLNEVLKYKLKERLREELKWQRAIQSYEESYSSSQGSGYETLLLDIQTTLKNDDDFRLFCQLYIDKRSYWEICEELHISKSALASRIYKMKKKLREFLK